MNLTIAQLRALVATVDRGSFTAAAAALGVGQSAVSHAVSALEREVGGPVVRRGGTAAPTPLGERLLGHARSVLASVDALEAVVRPGTARGTVRLAAVPTVCQGLLPRLRELWAVTLPDVDVQVYEGDDDEMPEWLEAGTVDAAVLVDPTVVPEGGVVVATDEMAAVVRRDHPLADATALTLDDLHEDGLVAGGGGCEYQIQRMHEIAGQPFRYAHRVREMSTMFGMIQRGEGVSIVPTLGRVMLPADLVMVPTLPRLERTLVLSGPSSRAWHPLARALVDAV
ncbi:LysR family transcriptional regulator [Curtobacterium sp. VKM Ac-2865]|uniref:LysR family transcriptional regulator n=1 Tax=Curtobacterium sp. VKM Ac-2865 TaxID=2783817 RepID=UPI00188D2D2B|nr:LysR family transcriptional regulator [Curtobacterium sp. VKM Ac-2865]MBF4583312.1 LysR family transcriptional regulator [Curtobacterium sp. VKM Ac-2865]